MIGVYFLYYCRLLTPLRGERGNVLSELSLTPALIVIIAVCVVRILMDVE